MIGLRWEYLAWVGVLLGIFLLATAGLWQSRQGDAGAGPGGMLERPYARLLPDPGALTLVAATGTAPNIWSEGTAYRFRLETNLPEVALTAPRQLENGAAYLIMPEHPRAALAECPPAAAVATGRDYPREESRLLQHGDIIHLRACSAQEILDDPADNRVEIRLLLTSKSGYELASYTVNIAAPLAVGVSPTPVPEDVLRPAYAVSASAPVPAEVHARAPSAAADDDDDAGGGVILEWRQEAALGYEVARRYCSASWQSCDLGLTPASWQTVAALPPVDEPVRYWQDRSDLARIRNPDRFQYRVRAIVAADQTAGRWSAATLAADGLTVAGTLYQDTLRLYAPGPGGEAGSGGAATTTTAAIEVLSPAADAGAGWQGLATVTLRLATTSHIAFSYASSTRTTVECRQPVVGMPGLSCAAPGHLLAADSVRGNCYRARLVTAQGSSVAYGPASTGAGGDGDADQGSCADGFAAAGYDDSLAVSCDRRGLTATWRRAPATVRGLAFDRYDVSYQYRRIGAFASSSAPWPATTSPTVATGTVAVQDAPAAYLDWSLLHASGTESLHLRWDPRHRGYQALVETTRRYGEEGKETYSFSSAASCFSALPTPTPTPTPVPAMGSIFGPATVYLRRSATSTTPATGTAVYLGTTMRAGADLLIRQQRSGRTASTTWQGATPLSAAAVFPAADDYLMTLLDDAGAELDRLEVTAANLSATIEGPDSARVGVAGSYVCASNEPNAPLTIAIFNPVNAEVTAVSGASPLATDSVTFNQSGTWTVRCSDGRPMGIELASRVTAVAAGPSGLLAGPGNVYLPPGGTVSRSYTATAATGTPLLIRVTDQNGIAVNYSGNAPFTTLAPFTGIGTVSMVLLSGGRELHRLTVTVSELTASIAGPATISAGSAGSYSCSANDPDAALTLTVNDPVGGRALSVQGRGSATARNVNYDRAGRWTAVCASGGSELARRTTIVTAAATAGIRGPSTVYLAGAGVDATYSATASATSTPLTLMISGGGVSIARNGTGSVTETATFTSAGSVTIVLRSGARELDRIRVNVTALTATIAGPTTATNGGSAALTCSANAPGATLQIAVSNPSGVVVATATSTSPVSSGSVTFNANGNWNAVCRQGGTTLDTHRVAVSSAATGRLSGPTTVYLTAATGVSHDYMGTASLSSTPLTVTVRGGGAGSSQTGFGAVTVAANFTAPGTAIVTLLSGSRTLATRTVTVTALTGTISGPTSVFVNAGAVYSCAANAPGATLSMTMTGPAGVVSQLGSGASPFTASSFTFPRAGTWTASCLGAGRTLDTQAITVSTGFTGDLSGPATVYLVTGATTTATYTATASSTSAVLTLRIEQGSNPAIIRSGVTPLTATVTFTAAGTTRLTLLSGVNRLDTLNVIAAGPLTATITGPLNSQVGKSENYTCAANVPGAPLTLQARNPGGAVVDEKTSASPNTFTATFNTTGRWTILCYHGSSLLTSEGVVIN